MTGVEPGVGDVTGPGAEAAAGVTLTTGAEAAPPPAVNCAKALQANAGINDKMPKRRNVFINVE